MNKEIEKTTKPEKKPIEFVLITICTRKRNESLKVALNSVKKLNFPENIRTEVLIVDNDVEESSKSTVESFIEFPVKINYVSEVVPGLANARNKALETAAALGASHILFFDDDTVLTENCLKAHVDFYNNNEHVMISSGPYLFKFEENTPEFIRKNIVYKLKTTKMTGQKRGYASSNNVFFPVSVYLESGLKFEKESNFSGGEDGIFFTSAFSLGYTIYWNNEALAYEIVTKERTRLSYIFKKSYHYGLSGSQIRFRFNTKNENKYLYSLKIIGVLLGLCLFLIPSILLGLTVFFNVLSSICKTKGKFDGLFGKKYDDIYKHI